MLPSISDIATEPERMFPFILAFWLVILSIAYMFTPSAKVHFLFGREYKKVKLQQVIEISHDTKKFRFQLPKNNVLGLPTGKHVKLKCPNPNFGKDTWNGRPDADKSETIERKYTPTTSNKDVGFFDLVIKVYKPNDKFADGGKMSQFLDGLSVGDEVEVSGPWGLNEYVGKGKLTRLKKSFRVDTIGMIAGGTGITPMLQVIAKVLSNPEDNTKLSLLFANQTEADILVREELETLQKEHPEQFKLHYTLDRPADGWKYSTGFVTDKMIEEHMPGKDENMVILMCGPPPMIKFACQANLDKLGYPKNVQIEF